MCFKHNDNITVKQMILIWYDILYCLVGFPMTKLENYNWYVSENNYSESYNL